jgi:hypothetical protein
MATSPSACLYRRLRYLHPNLDMVLRLAVHAVSVQCAQDGTGWKGTQEGRWVVVWTEYRRRRDQVRRCYHLVRLNPEISFRMSVQNFPDASLGISVAVDGQIFQTDVYSASHSSVKRGGRLNAFGAFRAVGDRSSTALNTSHFTDVFLFFFNSLSSPLACILLPLCSLSLSSYFSHIQRFAYSRPCILLVGWLAGGGVNAWQATSR